MARTICVILTAAEKTRLRAISEDRARPFKHVQRARIVLLSAERLPVLEVAHQAGISRTAVWRWQQRFAEEGVDGPAARQDPPAWQADSLHRHCRRGAGADLLRAARRGHPLDWSRRCGRDRHLASLGPAHLAEAPSAATPGAHLGLPRFCGSCSLCVDGDRRAPFRAGTKSGRPP